jgi:hypothetical protein
MSVTLVATILPWSIRNYRVYHRLMPISSGFYTKLWQGNNELANGTADDRELYWNDHDLGGWEKRLDDQDEPTRTAIREKYDAIERQFRKREAELNDLFLATDEVLAPVAKQWMREHPARVLRLAGVKFVTFFSAYSDTYSEDDRSIGRKRLLAGASFYPVLVFAAVGMFLELKRWRTNLVLYAILASVTASYCLLNTCTRFRLPLDMFLITFAAAAAAYVWEWWTAKQVTADVAAS